MAKLKNKISHSDLKLILTILGLFSTATLFMSQYFDLRLLRNDCRKELRIRSWREGEEYCKYLQIANRGENGDARNHQ